MPIIKVCARFSQFIIVPKTGRWKSAPAVPRIHSSLSTCYSHYILYQQSQSILGRLTTVFWLWTVDELRYFVLLLSLKCPLTFSDFRSSCNGPIFIENFQYTVQTPIGDPLYSSENEFYCWAYFQMSNCKQITIKNSEDSSERMTSTLWFTHFHRLGMELKAMVSMCNGYSRIYLCIEHESLVPS